MDEASSLSWYLWSERNKLWPFRFVQGADTARVLRARLPIPVSRTDVSGCSLCAPIFIASDQRSVQPSRAATCAI